MRETEQYDETIDYKELLTRYLKYLYKEWISVPKNAEKYPPMVKRDIQFHYRKITYDIPCGRETTWCWVDGDIYSLGVNMEEGEPINKVFYRLLNKVLMFGIMVYAHTEQVVDEKAIYSFYEGTTRDLMAQLGC